ncbi:hypothetical protein WJX77_001791 [Trebouxia sp. C0004]
MMAKPNLQMNNLEACCRTCKSVQHSKRSRTAVGAARLSIIMTVIVIHVFRSSKHAGSVLSGLKVVIWKGHVVAPENLLVQQR